MNDGFRERETARLRICSFPREIELGRTLSDDISCRLTKFYSRILLFRATCIECRWRCFFYTKFGSGVLPIGSQCTLSPQLEELERVRLSHRPTEIHIQLQCERRLRRVAPCGYAADKAEPPKHHPADQKNKQNPPQESNDI
jgi:hypothetical protein